MKKNRNESPVQAQTWAERMAEKAAERMRQRIAESNRLALEYEQGLDPRQRPSHAGP